MVSLFVVISFRAGVVPAGPIEDLKPGEWYEVPNSKLASAGVIPSPVPPGGVGPEGVMSAWSGGAYDTKRDRLIIWGGGHNDYGGNEIYAFDIKTFSWSRIWGPSADIPPVGTSCSETYSDGNPASRHTYDGLVYLPLLDKFWSGGGSIYCGSGGGSRGTWMFDFSTLTWQRKADAPENPVTVATDYDPITGHIFRVGDKSRLTKYDPLSNSYTVLKDTGGVQFGEETVGVVDPVNRLFVYLGNGYISAYNIQTGQLTQPSTTGGSAVINMRGPGLAYDPVTKKIIGWAGGTSVYSLDTVRWTWTEHKAATTNTVSPTSPTRVGVFGRFQYIPSRNAFVLVNEIYDSVFIYKLSQSTALDLPSSPPTSLRITGAVE